MRFSLRVILIFALLFVTGECIAGECSVGLPSVKGVSYRALVTMPSNAPDGSILLQQSSARGHWSTKVKQPLVGLRLPTECKLVQLPSANGTPTLGVVVVGDGETRRFFYVVKVGLRTASLHVLVSQYHEGKPSYHYDKSGQLDGFTLRFLAGHEVEDDQFTGHVFLAKDYVWSSKLQSFASKSLYVDSRTEANAGLVELLVMPGSERLGVKSTYSKAGARLSVVKFAPVGLLRTKVYKEMLWASVIEAGIEPSPGCEWNPHLVWIRAVK